MKIIPPMIKRNISISALLACVYILNVTYAQTSDDPSPIVNEQSQTEDPIDIPDVLELTTTEEDGYRKTDLWGFYCSPRAVFYHNEYLYLVAQEPYKGIVTQLYRMKIDNDGKVIKQEKLETPMLSKSGPHRCISAVVYRGLVYLFYDKKTSSETYKLCFKTSSDPAHETSIPDDQVWYPAGEEDHETKFIGYYKTWGAYGSATTIKAVVFNDKIYVFFWDKDDGVCYASFDGRDWSEWDVVRFEDYPPTEPFFIAEPITKKGKSMLCLGVSDTQRKLLSFAYMDKDEEITYGPTIEKATGRIQTNNYITSCVGSIEGEEQGNMLQILANNVSAVDSNLVRCQINLETDEVSPWKDTPMALTLGQQKRYFVPLMMTTVPTLDPQKKKNDPLNIRNYIITFFKPETPPSTAQLFIEQSDWFKDVTPRNKKKKKHIVDTDATKSKEPQCWQIIGVVEGCPPFSRNGIPGKDATASVKYGRSIKERISYKISYDLSISLEAELEGGMVKMGGKAESTFGLANQSVHEVTRSVDFTFQNLDDNWDGEKGWLIVSKPTLESKTYQRFTQDKQKRLGKYVVVSVRDVSLSFENYDLNNPPKGMLSRSKMSNLQYWKNHNPHWSDDYGGKIMFRPLDAIKVDNSGGKMTPSLSLKDEEETETTTKLSFEITSDFGKDELFAIKSTSGIEIEFVSSVTKTVTQNVSASLFLPRNEEGPVHELTVKPGWFLPKENVLLKDFGGTIPYWVSDAYAEANTVPWCLTWRVISSE